ncbi:UbiD family decarboxylase, partial [Salmonella enterica subsp. enterica serovar Montevideo]|nr:UbiD family decarboxylase [Salmonella enterica subsp. enterica serovar Montevideo]
WLYAALLLATMIWGVWEVGFDFWALTPRSDILVFFGIWLILPAENTVDGDAINLFDILPLFRLNDGDGGFYLDKACVVSRDPLD